MKVPSLSNSLKSLSHKNHIGLLCFSLFRWKFSYNTHVTFVIAQLPPGLYYYDYPLGPIFLMFYTFQNVWRWRMIIAAAATRTPVTWKFQSAVVVHLTFIVSVLTMSLRESYSHLNSSSDSLDWQGREGHFPYHCWISRSYICALMFMTIRLSRTWRSWRKHLPSRTWIRDIMVMPTSHGALYIWTVVTNLRWMHSALIVSILPVSNNLSLFGFARWIITNNSIG